MERKTEWGLAALNLCGVKRAGGFSRGLSLIQRRIKASAEAPQPTSHLARLLAGGYRVHSGLAGVIDRPNIFKDGRPAR